MELQTMKELKIRLKIDTADNSQDDLLLSYFNEIKEKVKNYCNRKDIPRALNYTLVTMTIDLYKFKDDENRLVLSETQGSRSLTYAGINDIDTIMTDYKKELNRYRRVRVI